MATTGTFANMLNQKPVTKKVLKEAKPMGAWPAMLKGKK